MLLNRKQRASVGISYQVNPCRNIYLFFFFDRNIYYLHINSFRWNKPAGIKENFMKKYNITREDYRMMEIVIIENKPYKAGPQWKCIHIQWFFNSSFINSAFFIASSIFPTVKKVAGAFYFATVVLAMIGYGHSTPVTISGKAFCMAYAMVIIRSSICVYSSVCRENLYIPFVSPNYI